MGQIAVCFLPTAGAFPVGSVHEAITAKCFTGFLKLLRFRRGGFGIRTAARAPHGNVSSTVGMEGGRAL
jgi:hypothetical protein